MAGGAEPDCRMMARKDLDFSPWWLLVAAAAVMGMAGIYQFGWSSIRLALASRLHTTETAIGTIFTLFVVAQTAVQFPAGWVRDRWGPRGPLLVSAALLAGGMAGTAMAGSVWQVYLFYTLGGLGAGIAYTIAVNTSVKWFDDRRGLATGSVILAYGGVSVVFIPAIRQFIVTRFVVTLIAMALLAGVVTVVAALVLRDPEPTSDPSTGVQRSPESGSATGDPPAAAPRHTGDDRSYKWTETVRTWQFWHLYVIFAVVNGVGLMLIGKVIAFAEAMSISSGAATGAASVVALGDAAGVVVIGGVSDRFDRERTAAASLVLCGLTIGGVVLGAGAGRSLVFVLLVGLAAFFRAAPFSIFPSIVGDYYGEVHSSANYALLYTAKIWGGIAGGTVASGLVVSLGWGETFLLGGVLIALAGLATAFVRPVQGTAAEGKVLDYRD